MAPVPQGIEVAHVEAVFQAFVDPCQAPCDLAGHEGFTTPWALVIEQDAVAGIHPIGLAVVHRDPVAVQLGYAVGASRVKRRVFFLGHLLHKAIKLTGAGLINPSFFR